jgi:hypothetical protein
MNHYGWSSVNGRFAMKWRVTWLVLAGSVLACGCAASSTGRAKAAAPGAEVPVTRARLADAARWEAINRSHSWMFKDEEFVLVATEKNEIPAALRKALLGADREAARVVGKWALDAKAGLLVLTAITAGDKPGEKEVKLKIGPAGAIRINIDNEQYNFVVHKEP